MVGDEEADEEAEQSDEVLEEEEEDEEEEDEDDEEDDEDEAAADDNADDKAREFRELGRPGLAVELTAARLPPAAGLAELEVEAEAEVGVEQVALVVVDGVELVRALVVTGGDIRALAAGWLAPAPVAAVDWPAGCKLAGWLMMRHEDSELSFWRLLADRLAPNNLLDDPPEPLLPIVVLLGA